MNDLSAYLKLRDAIRPGDVIAFSGREIISYLIDLFSGSNISHVAMVRHPADVHLGDVVITESTIEKGKSGPQDNLLGATLLGYNAGAQAWWLPLADDVRSEIDWRNFYAYLGAEEGAV
jgi:hypothetical protein